MLSDQIDEGGEHCQEDNLEIDQGAIAGSADEMEEKKEQGIERFTDTIIVEIAIVLSKECG